MSTHSVAPAMYVLNEKLQGQKPHGKWKERAHVGVYFGHSPRHSSTVAYVLNMTTGHVSAQFHLVFDDHFDTVLTTQTTSHSLWQSLSDLPNQEPDQPFEAPLVDSPPDIPRGF